MIMSAAMTSVFFSFHRMPTGREVRARFDVQSRHGELVAAEFLVVEIHFEIGSQQNLLCVSCGDASGKGEQE